MKLFSTSYNWRHKHLYVFIRHETFCHMHLSTEHVPYCHLFRGMSPPRLFLALVENCTPGSELISFLSILFCKYLHRNLKSRIANNHYLTTCFYFIFYIPSRIYPKVFHVKLIVSQYCWIIFKEHNTFEIIRNAYQLYKTCISCFLLVFL